MLVSSRLWLVSAKTELYTMNHSNRKRTEFVFYAEQNSGQWRNGAGLVKIFEGGAEPTFLRVLEKKWKKKEMSLMQSQGYLWSAAFPN